MPIRSLIISDNPQEAIQQLRFQWQEMSDIVNELLNHVIVGRDGNIHIDTNVSSGVTDENTITIAGTARDIHLVVHDEGALDITIAAHKHSNTANAGPVFESARSRGTEAAETVVQSGDYLGRMTALGFDGTDYARGAEIRAVVDGTPGSGDMPTRWEFLVTPDGSETPAIKLTIDNKGNVILGTAALATNATDGFLHVPSCAGTPTGTPTAYSGRVPHVFDTTNGRPYWYYGGAWHYAVLV